MQWIHQARTSNKTICHFVFVLLLDFLRIFCSFSLENPKLHYLIKGITLSSSILLFFFLQRKSVTWFITCTVMVTYKIPLPKYIYNRTTTHTVLSTSHIRHKRGRNCQVLAFLYRSELCSSPLSNTKIIRDNATPRRKLSRHTSKQKAGNSKKNSKLFTSYRHQQPSLHKR